MVSASPSPSTPFAEACQRAERLRLDLFVAQNDALSHSRRVGGIEEMTTALSRELLTCCALARSLLDAHIPAYLNVQIDALEADARDLHTTLALPPPDLDSADQALYLPALAPHLPNILRIRDELRVIRENLLENIHEPIVEVRNA